ncbi:uncharacterized protein [Watersipora subatra]|uniref:uncharacterized protein n=1 Tax=Watersipora subatra TaxID=2589382 RepID=UPI00355C5F79
MNLKPTGTSDVTVEAVSLSGGSSSVYGDWGLWDECSGSDAECSTGDTAFRTRSCTGSPCDQTAETTQLACGSYGGHWYTFDGTVKCIAISSTLTNVNQDTMRVTSCVDFYGASASLIELPESDQVLWDFVENLLTIYDEYWIGMSSFPSGHTEFTWDSGDAVSSSDARWYDIGLSGSSPRIIVDMERASNSDPYYLSDGTEFYSEGRFISNDPDSGEYGAGVACKGDDCGLFSESLSCYTYYTEYFFCQYNTVVAIVDGGWSVWSSWAACSGTCSGSNIYKRTRTCSNPTPVMNGLPCTGGDTQEVAIGERESVSLA